MLSKKVTCSVPKEQRPLAMSYTHGAHAPPCSIYYGGDHRVVPGQVAPLYCARLVGCRLDACKSEGGAPFRCC